LLAEMDSVKRVDETESRKRANEGASGTSSHSTSTSALLCAETGSGAPGQERRGEV
jgi:hypothetical protein